MKDKKEVKSAFTLWEKLTDLGDYLWNHYEKDFLELDMEQSQLAFEESLSEFHFNQQRQKDLQKDSGSQNFHDQDS